MRTNSDAAGPSATTNSPASAEVPSAGPSSTADAPAPDGTDARAPTGVPDQRDDAGAVAQGKSDAGTPDALKEYFSTGDVCPPGVLHP